MDLKNDFGANANVENSGMNEMQPRSFSTFPPNKGGKKYTLEEVFEVWFHNKDSILNVVKGDLTQNRQAYKSEEPESIYHLDLQNSAEPPLSNVDAHSQLNSLNNLISQLSTEDFSDSKSMQNLVDEQSRREVQSKRPVSLEHSSNAPESTEWFYIDPSGNEQGPFRGDMMQEWLNGGYLHLNLRIRTKDQNAHTTLQEFCHSVQDFDQPFMKALDDHSNLFGTGQPQLSSFEGDLYGVQAQPMRNLLPNGAGYLESVNMRLNPQPNMLANDFQSGGPDPFANPLNQPYAPSSQIGLDNLNSGLPFHQPLATSFQSINVIPSLLQNNMQQSPALSRTASAWGIDQSNSLIGSAPGTPVSVTPIISSQLSQPAPLSPWLNDISTHSRVSSPFVNTNLLSEEKRNTQEELRQLNLNDRGSYVDEGRPDEQSRSDPVHFDSDLAASYVSVSRSKDNLLHDEYGSKRLEEYHAPAPPQSFEMSADAGILSDNQDVELKADRQAKYSTAKSVVAPWASVTTVTELAVKPQLTLKEIQVLEADKHKERKKQDETVIAEQKANLPRQEKQQDKAYLPKTSRWGVEETKPKPVAKTLAEIQREEAEAARARNSSKHAVPKSTFANALASSLANEKEAWITVPSKKQVTKKPQQVVTTSFASKATPQLLRSVSAGKATKPAVNSQALKEEFLMWARASMTNLYPTVSKDDLLEIFTTLPSNNDSLQIISETIYSSSATMDGRRFAQDFTKRRQKVQLQIDPSDDISWSTAISSSAKKIPTVDEDGWSTTAKPKKKGRKP